jgi:uncharacterized membrane protein
MDMPLLMTLFFSILPISELRGAIPYAVSQGMPLMQAALVAIAANASVPLIAFLFLGSLHRLLYRVAVYRRFFDSIVVRARSKVHEKVEKYGYWGLMLFVAVPLPITGAWTGALGAWVLGLSFRKSFLAIAAGVVIAGVIVAALVMLWGAGAQTIFFKAIR